MEGCREIGEIEGMGEMGGIEEWPILRGAEIPRCGWCCLTLQGPASLRDNSAQPQPQQGFFFRQLKTFSAMLHHFFKVRNMLRNIPSLSLKPADFE